MDKDRIVGSARDFAGRVASAVRNIAGDPKTEAAGQLRDRKGTAQNSAMLGRKRGRLCAWPVVDATATVLAALDALSRLDYRDKPAHHRAPWDTDHER